MLNIKWKNISRIWYLKAIAFVVMIACTVGCVGTFWYGMVYKNLYQADLTASGNYVQSSELRNNMTNYLWDMLNLQYRYVNEEHIQAGLALEKLAITNQYNNAYNDWANQNGNLTFSGNGKSYYDDHYYGNGYDRNSSYDAEDSMQNRDLSFQEFEKRFPDLKESIKEGLIQDQLREYNRIKQQWEKQSDFTFKVRKNPNENESTNAKKEAEQSPCYISASAKAVAGSDNYLTEHFYEWKSTYSEFADLKDDVITVTVAQPYIDQQQKNLDIINAEAKTMIVTIAILFAIALAMFVYLAVVTGRKGNSDELHLIWIDRIWSELQMLIGGAVIAAFTVTIGESLMYGNYGTYHWRYDSFTIVSDAEKTPDLFLFYWVLIGTALASILISSFLLSQIRRLKGRRFLDGFIVIRLIKKVLGGLLVIWHGGRLMSRVAILAVLVPILSATWIGTPFMIAFLLFLAYRYINDFRQLCEGVKKIKSGDVGYTIAIAHKGDLKDLAEDINTLSTGLNSAISTELSSERLKSKRISKVCQDLQTPLTTIITYTDLLQKEEIENETAKEYVEAIDQNAQHLNILTTDLFAAAKASNGSLSVNLEKVDLTALIQQGLAEFEDQLQASELDIRTNLPEHPLYIKADGRLMWQVLENLLSNVVTHARHQTRVYLDVIEHSENSTIEFTMKNISNSELNRTMEDIQKHLNQGNPSHTTKRSGLGLNISNSLINLQHGQFHPSIDGDLFKITIILPIYP